jgi:hypothetical protein
MFDIKDSNSFYDNTKNHREKSIETRSLKDVIRQELLDAGISLEMIESNIRIVNEIEVNSLATEVTETPIHDLLASSMGSPTLYRQVSDGMKVELIEWLNAAKINKKCYYLDKAIKNLIAIRVDFLPVRCLISL